MSMGWRTALKSGEEYDALTGWRRLYVYLKRAGVRSSIKRKVRRRDRHESKRLLDRSEDRE